jgi:hypothetical protein
MKRLRSLDQISTFSCDYALDLAFLINVPYDTITLSCNNMWYVMNNIVVLDSKKKFDILYKEICVDYYFANQMGIIQKKDQNWNEIH